jgi:hypothetical protein
MASDGSPIEFNCSAQSIIVVAFVLTKYGRALKTL